MPYDLTGPNSGAQPLPLLYDSPHSGRVFPDGFASRLASEELRRAEDAYVDHVFAGVPEVGGTLITANFPRIYIDPNRAVDDIDPAALDGEWPTLLNPGEKSKWGKGLVWKTLRGQQEIYDHRLSVNEVQHRIDHYWQPYHSAVSDAIEAMHSRFGCVFHINCHSMRGTGYNEVSDKFAPRPDFVLSNRDGASCEPSFINMIAHYLSGCGFEVSINDPFKGAELTKAYSNPADRRHSLQIEINRTLYLKDGTYDKRDDFDAFYQVMQGMNETCAGYVQKKLK